MAFANVPDVVPSIVMTGVNVLIALDLAVLRTRKLVRRGYAETAVVSGRDRMAAELRFFDQWPHSPVGRTAARPAPRPEAPPSPPVPPALRPGLIEGPPSWRLAQGHVPGQPGGHVIGSLDTGNSGA